MTSEIRKLTVGASLEKVFQVGTILKTGATITQIEENEVKGQKLGIRIFYIYVKYSDGTEEIWNEISGCPVIIEHGMGGKNYI